MKRNLAKLPTFDSETRDLTVVIETPKGSRNKFDYDEKLGVFKLANVLPEGAIFRTSLVSFHPLEVKMVTRWM